MFTFRPNHTLLNPKFEGYKLDSISEDNLPVHHALQRRPSQTAFSGKVPLSFQEVQSRIRHNHLAISPDTKQAVYIDAELRVIAIKLDNETPLFRTIYELPEPMQTSLSENYQREYPSAVFLNTEILFVSDGHGLMYVLTVPSFGEGELLGTYQLPTNAESDTSPSSSTFQIHTASPVSEVAALVLLSSRHHDIKDTDTAPASAFSRKRHVQFDLFAARIDLPVRKAQDSGIPNMEVVWRRRGEDVPIYTAYDRSLKTFLLAGNSPYRPLGTSTTEPYVPVPDEIAPIPREGDNPDGTNTPTVQKPPPYAWTQDSEELTVVFPLPASTLKSDIHVLFSPQTLTAIVHGESSETVPIPHYSAARLWGSITPSSSFWTWDAQGTSAYGLLALHLEKQHEGTRWLHVFDPVAQDIGTGISADVPETLDPSELHNIRESLEKYTMALSEGKDPSGLGLGSGVPGLEGEMDDEVDAAVGSMVCLTWVAEDGTEPVWARDGADTPVNILSTPLPGTRHSGVSVVVKSTVDGLVYTLSHGESPTWQHTSTYSALAFVLASKRDTRFTYHVPSKAVLAFESGTAEYGGNLYIYRASKPKDMWAKQAILKIGGGAAGSVLGVGAVQSSGGHLVILCLCEGELIVLPNII
ncbi:hypothetical protein EW146_g7784 [Bondarzewia mesenterica]|uniref:NudC domain-containing protein 1 n=1 Tax=Bondarzewia mesenterica TaxID=1095465 RepID=A0A4S4LLC6_9AGAM|nr:hypothetical protein EW146_g7784 [Bondarzewia mesenterica]